MPSRKYRVRRREEGQPLGDWLCRRLNLSRGQMHEMLCAGKVQVNDTPCLEPGQRVRAGQMITVRTRGAERTRSWPSPSTPLPDQVPPPSLYYVDDHLVVVDKPAGLTTMRHPEEIEEFGQRARRFLPATLADILPGLLPTGRSGRPVPVRAVHRLDRDTSGLVVFARTAQAERELSKQFRAHSTERRYQAVVRGQARSGRIESWLVRDRGDGRRGSGPGRGEGQRAITHVRVLEHLGAYTLVECRLETGRTHQVRIHLGEAGTPLCGERVYDRPLHGSPLPDDSGIARTALHATTLALDHPSTGQRLRWTSPLPADIEDLLRRLRIADLPIADCGLRIAD